jgi:nitroreductase
MCRDGKDLYELAVSRRSIRQFKPEALPDGLLDRLVNAARLAPSAANMQPLEFVVVTDAGLKRDVFPCLKWAAYIAPAGDPAPGHEPAAYVVTLVNTGVREKMYEYDVGAAVENMILAAWAEGVGSCWLLSIDRDRLRDLLNIPASYRIDCVLALGYPAEEPEAAAFDESCKYWKDGQGRLHVPKRSLEDILHRNRF